ncbi:hypothetical protein CXG81DRAFT_25862 [Caulochytrium protostelioides]|uniref:Zinc/iron permease n=1 Tax=Caulochytrium protostelioides TaxID=1555241 RepID=A0A4P9X894_9FUNG|nr:hypothetical protein CXG81DRAFT_25862 [Caulochytrium protostelioides]|eukprot:RKP01478.1 hypothetical protein CXG81DRAFT_25862 [Caulochytrium protostelioides]
MCTAPGAAAVEAGANVLQQYLAPYIPVAWATALGEPHVAAFTLSAIASTGTLLGGLLVLIPAKLFGANIADPRTKRMMGWMEAFSGGVMLYMTFTDLLPEAETDIGKIQTMLFFFLGVLLFLVLDLLLIPRVESATGTTDEAASSSSAAATSSLKASSQSRTNHPSAVAKAAEHAELMRTSMVTFLALTLHNAPEGLGVYLAGLSSLKQGVQFSVAILLHNIPEGMVVAIPTYVATGSATWALFLTLLSGLAEPAGVVIGSLALAPWITPQHLSRCLACVGGIMAAISIHELQPAAQKYAGKTAATLAAFTGMLVAFVSLEGVGLLFDGHHHGHGHSHSHSHGHGHGHSHGHSLSHEYDLDFDEL